MSRTDGRIQHGDLGGRGWPGQRRAHLPWWRSQAGTKSTTKCHASTPETSRGYPNKVRVWISGQVRRTTKTLRREMKRRAAVEPVTGHVKAEHRMDRNYLKGRDGDRINAVLAATGYNFSLLIRWMPHNRKIRSALQRPKSVGRARQ